MNRRKSRGRVRDSAGSVAAQQSAEVADLAKQLRQDRLARRLSWPAYVQFLSGLGRGGHLNMSTIYKLANGITTNPNELTILDLKERLADAVRLHPITEDVRGGATREVVPG